MGQARRSTREPPVPSSSRTLAARLQAVPAASNRRAVLLTVIAHTRLASTAQGFPKRLMVQVQGHLAPWERACQRLPHASRHAEANDHSTRTTGIGPGAKLARAVVAFLFPLDRWQPQQRNHRTSYSTTCANTKRFLPPPCPREGTPIHPRLKKNGAFWAVLCKSHHAAADTQMWGFSPVNKRSQRLAHDGSRYVWPSRVSTQIDKNRVKRSAPEAGFQAINGGAAHHWGQFPTFEGKTDSHGRSFTIW